LALNTTKKIWPLIPLFIIGLYLNYKLIKDADNQFILDGMIELTLIIGFLLVFFLALYRDYKFYYRTKLKLSFLTSFIGFLLVLSCITIYYFLEARDNSPILIKANTFSDINGASFEFREDGAYKFVNSSVLNSDISRGTYEIQGGTITLDKSNIDNFIKSKNLVFSQSIDPNSKLMIYQVNDKNEIIDEPYGFTVIEDHRKK